MFATTDYNTDVHNVYLSASYFPVKDLRATATAVYNKAKGKLDRVNMPDVSDRLDGELDYMDYTFEEMDTYSDLDYDLYQFMIGFEYILSPMWMITFDAEYAKLEDNTGYVYGIETGSYFTVRSGARITF